MCVHICQFTWIQQLKRIFSPFIINVGSYQWGYFKMTGIMREWELPISSDMTSVLCWKLTFSIISHFVLSANLKAGNWYLQSQGQEDIQLHANDFYASKCICALSAYICFLITFLFDIGDMPWVVVVLCSNIVKYIK